MPPLAERLAVLLTGAGTGRRPPRGRPETGFGLSGGLCPAVICPATGFVPARLLVSLALFLVEAVRNLARYQVVYGWLSRALRSPGRVRSFTEDASARIRWARPQDPAAQSGARGTTCDGGCSLKRLRSNQCECSFV